MMPGIILASGYGSLRRCEGKPYPKTLECIQGKPMIARIVETAMEARATSLVVVVNPLFREAIIDKLADYPGLRFAVQPDRFGAADAIQRGVNELAKGEENCVVLYGDMPLWKPDTVWRLMQSHQRHNATISLAPVSLNAATPPELARYGRVLRHDCGSIRAVVDPAEGDSNEVNPSLWAINTAWFCGNFDSIPAASRGDSHPPERSPQPLVALADAQGATVGEAPVFDAREALGVNSSQELERVRELAGGY